ncbi:type VI secretion system baseplate subunit TssF [Xinfangfangia sp. CPCC 101601]|uniref:Type VI secretion system baseplate subunit TssF n=1 Tax=Pseudogemmobacter lacusdianii TaxID=3069608 RepID=A0ABU0VVM0_9RHOB|nr:type VI secretion system baseplate subunit TssF [Xinfangfangia sp. CPCC 101601]MDQ2065693.1 type VI secretion system baseplate subunit TssF [Xinfangfangia sp. CPCC 101601]
MDRAFLSYYEAELSHVRELSQEFAALHPTVARNLSLDAVPCPDPYVERLLEGVAYLAARTRLKLDAEGQRHVRGILDALYPDLAGPAPAMSMVVLHPGPQVQTMADGHLVKRGTKLVAALRDGIATRVTYTTAQDVTLWPVALETVEYLQDRGALASAGVPDRLMQGAEAGLRLVLKRVGAGALADLSLDRLAFEFSNGARSGAIFDAVFAAPLSVIARKAEAAGAAPFHSSAAPDLLGIRDDEALLPRLRPAFEGYRLMREYFLMPERFHGFRLTGLRPAIKASSARMEVILPMGRPAPALASVSAKDFRLFTTPVVNLFEKECNIVELDARTTAHVVHADRSRPLDFEIHRLLRVSDAEVDGAQTELHPLYAPAATAGSGLVYTTERRPRRPGTDELRRGQTRTSYTGDDLFISVARPHGVQLDKPLKRLDIRALVSNRDLPIFDDTPKLGMDTGDPVARVELVAPMRRPRSGLVAGLPQAGRDGEAAFDDLTWRLVGQLSLNHLSLAEETQGAEPLRAMLELYADRGDPALARHVRSLTRISSRQIIERLDLPGPLALGKGIEITLHIDEGPLSGSSVLLLSALMSRLFARHASLNAFVRTKTRLQQKQEEVSWPMCPGNRDLI